MVVDQSGRIEETNHHSVVALADKKEGYTVEIPSKVKNELLTVFRKIGKPKTFPVVIFAVSIFLLLLKSKFKPQELIIDVEYPGHENTIKNIILTYCRKFKIVEPEIHFSNIGKKDPAHNLAWNTFKGNKKTNCVLKFEDFKGFFRMRSKRK
jgi:hypothetical protein